MPEASPAIKKLENIAARTAVRLRLQATLSHLATRLPVLLGYVMVCSLGMHLNTAMAAYSRSVWLGAAVLFVWLVGTAGFRFFQHRGVLFGAQQLDRHYQLADRVSNALEFSQLPETEQSPLMAVAVRDAATRIEHLNAAAAAPLRLPGRLLLSAALGLAAYGTTLLPRPHPPKAAASAPAPQVAPLELHIEDIELLQQWATELEQESEDPEVRAAVRRFNELVEDVAKRRISRQELFRRLAQLEQQLDSSAGLESAALEEGLKALAKELKRSSLTKSLAEALEDKRLKDAAEAMRQLAKKLKEKPASVNKSKLARLRSALANASKSSSGRLERLNAERQRVESARKRLLNKKSNGKSLSKPETRELKRHEQSLKRLSRQQKQSKARQKALTKLDRELAKAAAELMKEMGQSAESLMSGAEDLQQMAQRELTRRQKKELKKQLEQMRKILQQQRKAGADPRTQQLDRFRKRARGKGRGEKKKGKNGSKGSADGRPGKIRLMPGAGSNGLIPMPASGSGTQSSSGQNKGSESGRQGESGQWGNDSNDNLRGDKSATDGRTQDVTAAGIDSGEGSASSEVVFGAAEKGFTGGGYKRIYTDYETVAEEVMSHDEIPPGYKFYVRRYFQLIRPRQ